MRRILLISCLFLSVLSYAKKWDAAYISKLIAGGEIDKVIEFYKDRYYGENRDPQDAFRIADLYVKKKDYAAALQWYDKESQLINTSKVNLFNYANTNRLMGEYQKALDGYLMYAALTGDVNKVMDLANQCEKVLRSSALAYNYKLENYSYNTSADEGYVALLRTNAVYITSKPEEKSTSTILQVVRQYEGFSAPVRAYYGNVPKLIITGLSYSKDGNTVVFSATDEKTAKKGKSKVERLYTADNLGGSFLNVKPLNLGVDGYTMKEPSFNGDGSEIYFSSNMPGGLGGFDIWVTKWVNNKWTTPQNLGKLLNTPANEVNPFISQTEKENSLYFASDREGGFGGFDIYAAKQSGGQWQGVEIMPAPVNSAGDEISIIYDDEVKTGYFCSNRAGGKGGFDVYRFLPFNLKLNVYTRDTFSEKPVDYALVQVFDGADKLLEGVTDENGNATFRINKDKTYTLKISKDSYRTVTQKVSSAGKGSGDSVEVPALLKPDAQFSASKGATNSLSLDNFIIFTGTITDAATNKVASKVKMRMVNYTTQKVRQLDVDSAGRFEIKLLLNNNYKIIFENQENKITDELTTLGMEKNTVKIRDYVLNGNKFKLTENKVYYPGNVPPGRKITLLQTPSSTASTQPVSQTKIDSLLKVIAGDKPVAMQTVSTPVPATANTSVIVEKKEIPAVAPVVVNEMPAKKDTMVVPEIKQEIAGVKQEVKEPEKPVSTVVAPSLAPAITPSTPSLAPEEPAIQLAADMTPSDKGKKVKVIESTEKKKTRVTKEMASAAEVEAQEKVDSLMPTTSVAKTETVKVEPELPKEVEVKEVPSTPIGSQPEKPALPAPVKTEAPVAPTVPTKEVVLPDVYFKIQLASYDEGNIKFPEFENIGKVEEVKAYDRFIYRLGNFETLDRAKEILEMVRAQGYFVAFILQYNKDKVTGIVR